MTNDASPSVSCCSAVAEPLHTHQLAGLDPRERGFSRPVECRKVGAQYQAQLQYEALRVAGLPHETQAQALSALIALLHQQGYRQLKTQLSFRGSDYLGSREAWIEYPDPTPEPQGWWARVMAWCAPRSRTDRST